MRVRCNMCEEEFDEKEIVYDGNQDAEYCPRCEKAGYLMDLSGDIDGDDIGNPYMNYKSFS